MSLAPDAAVLAMMFVVVGAFAAADGQLGVGTGMFMLASLALLVVIWEVGQP